MKHIRSYLPMVIAALGCVAQAADQSPEKKITLPIYFQAPFLLVLGPDYTSVKGSIVYPEGNHDHDNRPADALNVVKIECIRATMSCVEADALIHDNADATLDVLINLWDITEYSATKVGAQTGGLCGSSTLTINAASNQVSILQENGGIGNYKNCTDPKKGINGHAMYEPLSHPIIWTVVDGMCLPFMDSRFSEWLKIHKEDTADWKQWAAGNCPKQKGSHEEATSLDDAA